MEETLSNRQKALNWWNTLDSFSKAFIVVTTNNESLIKRNPEHLTGREIEQLHKEYLRYECNI